MLVLRKCIESIFFGIDVNTFLTQEVGAIGRKFPGSLGFVRADSLGINQEEL